MDELCKNFGKIYDEFIAKIYRFVYLKVNSQEIAEDLTSKVFLKGWESFKEKNAEIQNPGAFLYKIAGNLVIDHYRQRGKTTAVLADYSLADPNEDSFEKAVLSADVQIVRDAISGLKKDYQNVIIWHYLDDMPTTEIAEILDKPEGTVRVMLHRGLNMLRDKLGSNEA